MLETGSSTAQSLALQSNNTFDFLRLTFAIFVIITHSYALTGLPEKDLLYQITNSQLSFSHLGLSGFFAISGFLITKSLLTSRSVKTYLKKRVLRIYPGLFLALIMCVLVGWVVTEKSTTAYFLDSSPWEYLFLKLTMIGRMPHYIDGVFASNPFPGEINGSLWTIPYEFIFYILLIPLFYIRNNKTQIQIALITAFVVAVSINFRILPVPGYILSHLLSPFKSVDRISFFSFAVYFLMGALLYMCFSWVEKHKKAIFVVSLFIIMLSILLYIFSFSKYFLLPLAVISLGLCRIPIFGRITETLGDLSYGIYIYAFLIQQTLMNYFRLNHVFLTLITIPIAMLFGYLSWHIIEKRALRLKEKQSARYEPSVVGLEAIAGGQNQE